MARFFLPPSAWLTELALSGDEARHLSQVLRMKVGDSIIVFDGHGRRASAEILNISRDRIPLKLKEILPSRTPLPVITLAQAIPKGKNMDWIVQKAVELGVSRIQPLVTRHTIVSPSGDKAEKWRRTALEACKQCGQFTIPIIEDPLPFAEWLANRPSADLEIIASLADNPKNFRETLQIHPNLESITIAIGPEGDFSPEEMTAALAAGFVPITLGDLVLRVETATMFCLSAIRFHSL